MSLATLAFLNPWLLGALVTLPLIYLLLRAVPPRPTQVPFPATRILIGLESPQKTPARTPWWLMLIRLLAAALVILALAEPVLNPSTKTALKGSGPVILVVDNTWAAASHWPDRVRMIDRLITEAESQLRTVVILPTATANRSFQVRNELPGAARSTAAALVPEPFAPRRQAAADALDQALKAAPAAASGTASVVWLTDGLDHDGAARDFADRLAALGAGSLIVVDGRPGEEALGLAAALSNEGRLEAQIVRAEGRPRSGRVFAYSAKSQRLGEATFAFGADTLKTTAIIDLPLELRNQVTRLDIAGERSAGAVQLLDARSQWQRIAVISGDSQEQAQELLAPLHYVTRALSPFAELVQPPGSNLLASLELAIARNISILLLADVGVLSGDANALVDKFVKRGGVLVRFAGPRLEKGGDDLMPVALRLGGRTLGGALSWSTPQPLAPFTDDSLFAGLAVSDEVVVTRQVLADPAKLGPDVKVWAKLKDGTPLVTATRRGAGYIALFHVTANSNWSNLPLSGLFVEMLRRISSLGKLAGTIQSVSPAGQVAGATPSGSDTPAVEEAQVLAPAQLLDGFGVLRAPPPLAEAILSSAIGSAHPSNINPPGYYGPPDGLFALNLIDQKTELKPMPSLPLTVERRAYEGQSAVALKADLLTVALALLLVDMAAVLALQGFSQWARRLAGGRAAALVALALVPPLMLAIGTDRAAAQTGLETQRPRRQLGPLQETQAQSQPVAPKQSQLGTSGRVRPGSTSPSLHAAPKPAPLTAADQSALRATRVVTFGYISTGQPDVDRVSRQGLFGLGRVLALRTALEPGEPVAVDVERDEIAFYPILYWPVQPNAAALPEKTLAKIDAYMKQGGMIIFDTKDFGSSRPAAVVAGDSTPLQRLLGRLDIPRLEPVADSHVLTRSFYIIRSFPGRWDGGQLWAEADVSNSELRGRQAQKSDGVSSILVTSNDLAAAWATDDRGQPMYPVVPGGEAQREMAYRTGVNIVMYALTGNYKSDQVHIPALLERLGQ